MLRHIRVTSKHDLSERLMALISDINREPNPPHLALQKRRRSVNTHTEVDPVCETAGAAS